jgi:hypothetical protein
MQGDGASGTSFPCRVLNQAAKEIERLREEIKQLRSGSK